MRSGVCQGRVCGRVCELRTHEIQMSSARHLLRRVAGKQSKAGKEEETETEKGKNKGEREAGVKNCKEEMKESIYRAHCRRRHGTWHKTKALIV